MTFIDWSDSEEMLGLLADYVSDERNDPANDAARIRFLSALSKDLASLAREASELSPEEAIERLRALRESDASEFAGDPVLTHIEE